MFRVTEDYINEVGLPILSHVSRRCTHCTASKTDGACATHTGVNYLIILANINYNNNLKYCIFFSSLYEEVMKKSVQKL